MKYRRCISRTLFSLERQLIMRLEFFDDEVEYKTLMALLFYKPVLKFSTDVRCYVSFLHLVSLSLSLSLGSSSLYCSERRDAWGK